jgi:hypothetical protein
MIKLHDIVGIESLAVDAGQTFLVLPYPSMNALPSVLGFAYSAHCGTRGVKLSHFSLLAAVWAQLSFVWVCIFTVILSSFSFYNRIARFAIRLAVDFPSALSSATGHLIHRKFITTAPATCFSFHEAIKTHRVEYCQYPVRKPIQGSQPEKQQEE